VFDGGASDVGRPYIVMEYVAGVPITEYWDHNRLSTRDRLALFLDPARFRLGDRPGFLLRRGDGGRVAVLVSPGLEPDAGPLEALLNVPPGLPVDPFDLVASEP
jgi:hypothetical protein